MRSQVFTQVNPQLKCFTKCVFCQVGHVTSVRPVRLLPDLSWQYIISKVQEAGAYSPVVQEQSWLQWWRAPPFFLLSFLTFLPIGCTGFSHIMSLENPEACKLAHSKAWIVWVKSTWHRVKTQKEVMNKQKHQKSRLAPESVWVSVKIF